MTSTSDPCSDFDDSAVLEDLDHFMNYDKSVSRASIIEAKRTLTFYKRNIENREDVDKYHGLLVKITNCLEKLDLLLVKEGSQVTYAREVDPSKVIYKQDRDYIGHGAFGIVYRATYAGTTVAVKVPKNPLVISSEVIRMFRQEANIMSRIVHPNIVQFLGGIFEPSNVMIITQLMCTDLHHLVHENPNPLSTSVKLKLAYETALGLCWLHDVCSIIHRDIKPENILVDEHLVAHLTDFGFSQQLQGGSGKDIGRPVGTILYTAPEILLRKTFTFSADVHSFGLVLYELFTGVRPFDHISDVPTFQRCVAQNNERPIFKPGDSSIPNGIKTLAQRCWDVVPTNRPKMTEVVDEIARIIIDTAMPGETNPASIFWKTHFFKPFRFTIPWDDFKNTIIRNGLKVSPEEFDMLKNDFCKQTKDSSMVQPVVTMEKFQQMYLWFGRWFQSPGEGLVHEMAHLFTQPWYHNDIDSNVASSRLSGRHGGTFLIRLSYHNRRTPFTISLMQRGNNTIVHFRINRVSYSPTDKVRYSTQDGATFQTIDEIVQYYYDKHEFLYVCPKEIINLAY